MAKRYNDFNNYLKERFGCRVQKITVDAGFSCPNRDGTLSRTGCTYCDAKGSGTGAARTGLSISDQIQQGKARLAARYKAQRYIVYFQAFTNTYAPCHVLKSRYDEALEDPGVVGLAIGTRPDCIDEKKLDLVEQYAAKHMVWIEYGLQSVHNRTLKEINRGHTFEDFVHAVRITQDRNILICAHVILGLPGESKQDILHTARAIADLGINGIKIHSLYVVKNTPMARLYRSGSYTTLDQHTYVDWVIAFLERLCPDTVIQRLTGDPKPSALLVPAWALHKQQTLSMIRMTLDDRNSYQGKFYGSA